MSEHLPNGPESGNYANHPARPTGSAIPTRLYELLADQASGELDPGDAAELKSLLWQNPKADAETFDRISAMLLLQTITDPIEAMPAELRSRLLADAKTFTPLPTANLREKGPVAIGKSSGSSRRAWWTPLISSLATAAILLIGFAIYTHQTPSEISAEKARATLLASAKDVNPINWSAGPDAAGQGVTGDVVWSNSAQTGFMRFKGLAQNNPAQSQYQLWIFDKNQDDATPVDGGVFDITKGGEIVVPIHAKLHITSATLFAITIEKPGGVVVSKRGRLPVLAKVSAG